MSNLPPDQTGSSADLGALFAETPWPIALLSAGGQILALNRPMCALLCDDGAATIGKPVDTLIPDQERRGVRSLLKDASTERLPAPSRAHIRRRGQPPMMVELEVLPVPDDPSGRLTLIVHPLSLTYRRERLILELNQVAPTLLLAQSPEEVFSQAARALEPLGMGMGIALLDPDHSMLRLSYATVSSAITNYLIDAAGFRHANMPIPLTTHGFGDVMTQRKGLFWAEYRAILRQIVPPPVAAICQALLRLQGIRGFIFAPLLAGDQIYGVIAVWSYALSLEDVPFIEAFGHQIAGVLAQIELRRRTERQIQRLDSLAATARAVTTLGSLDDVLRVICDQAQALLGAEHAAIALPIEAGAATICVMATGRGAAKMMGMRLPAETSVIGEVLRTGQGRYAVDTLQEPGIYAPAMAASPSRSALFQPLYHQNAILGVLVVNHLEPGRFSQADLDYLARYAEYAAVAIANAQLHTALQESAAANARLYREAEAIRSYLNTLIQHTPDVLLTIRRDMTIQLLNPERIAHALGYHPDQLASQPFLRFTPPALHEKLLGHWQAILDGQPQSFEAAFLRADGTTISTILSAALIPDYDEVFVIVKDVTNQKEIEARLRQTEKLAALGRLAAGAAHELNNPLAAILGLAQLQLMEDLPATTRADIENIERSAVRASQIVQHLRTFARPRQSEPQPLDMAALIQETLDRLVAEIGARSVEVAVELASDLPPTTGDPHQIEQVLFNIVHNAVLALAANPPGAPRALTIRGWPEARALHLAIGDSGPGIAPEELPRIFDPFFTTRRVGEGTGLGLSIVHAIVQQHSGNVWAESAPGKGTTFHIELPIARPEASVLPAAEPRAVPSAPDGATILLVEDEEAVRTVTARMLARLGYRVDAAGSGAEALERALAQDYQLVISDLQMPGVDGPMLYERLRAARPALRWLMLTGDTLGEGSREFLRRTELPVLPKPFTREQLIERVTSSFMVKPET